MNSKQINPQDMLSSIFTLQSELNDIVFESNSIQDNDGSDLTMAKIVEQVNKGALAVNDLPNQWLSKYSRAITDELEELNEELLWKWWSKDSINIQNTRVELIDILHFLVSAMIVAGLTSEKVHDLYIQKHSINLQRQNTNYNRQQKSEKDNKSIK